VPMEVSGRQITQHTLGSHFLTGRSAGADLVAVVDRLCGLNAQAARTPYLSLWSRVEGFRRDELAQVFRRQRRLIKTWLMRGTVHMVPTGDFYIYRRALGNILVDGWMKDLDRRGLMLPEARRKKLHGKVLEALTHGPRTKKELLPEVRHLMAGHDQREQKMRLGWILRELSYRGLICHGESTGPWYHFKEHRFVLVDHWIRGQDVVDMDENDARRRLLMKYLRGYGPASVADFAHWAGLKMAAAKEIFAAAQAELIPIHIAGQKAPGWILREDMARLRDSARESDEKASPPVRFLPEFDSLIMGHKDKSRLLDEAHRKKVFLRLADVAAIFLVDGRVAGTWNYRMTTRKMELHPFGKLGAEWRPRVDHETENLRSFFEAEGRETGRR
jgi:uncharacterized protein YcaQ